LLVKLKIFITDLLFPVVCLGCGHYGQWLCPECLKKIKLNSDGKYFQQPNIKNLNGVWIAANYQEPFLAEALKNFKYNGVIDLGGSLGQLLIRFLAAKISQGEITGFDLITAVPLTKKRRLWRGFNQAEILAEAISRKFGWPSRFDLIKRRYQTFTQVGLKAAERQSNVKGIFQLGNEINLEGKKILLIDDVMTTGSTINECAEILRKAGAKEIWGLVLAKN
jgi:ComF family protein